MVPGKKYIHSRRTYSWSLQLGSSCRVEDGFGPKQLEIGALDLCQATDDMGSSRGRPLCSSPQQTATTLLRFPTISRGRSSGRSGPNMVEPETVCLSTVHTDRQVPEEADTRLGERDDNVSSILAKSDMVPKPAESANRSCSFATRPKRDLTNPQEFHPLVEQGSLSLVACRVSGLTCRMEEFQRSLLRSYQQPGDVGQRKHTHQHGRSGYFGVISRNPIPFHPLSDQW